MTKSIFFSKDVVVCDLIWTHPDIFRIHSESIEDPDTYKIYINYEIFQYPSDRISDMSEVVPQFIFTKRGCVMPKFAVYKNRSGAYNRLEKEKENWDKDVENFQKLLRMGKAVRT